MLLLIVSGFEKYEFNDPVEGELLENSWSNDNDIYTETVLFPVNYT